MFTWIESTTIGAMNVGIYAGQLLLKIIEIKTTCIGWFLMGVKCVCKNFSKTIRGLLGGLLHGCLKKAYRQKLSAHLRKGNTYDILDVETSTRFVALDGQIYHNCLGLSYQMSKFGLANKLTLDTGKPVSEDGAQDFIDLFYEKFSALEDFQENTLANYEVDGFIRLSDGWYMWGDNDNFRSVGNIGVQGAGAVVMRKAVDLAAERGLEVILTLHDALYSECDANDWEAVDALDSAMKEAFVKSFKHPRANLIGTDIAAWGACFKEDAEITTKANNRVHVSEKYIDERAVDEYKKFSKYFEREDDSWL